MAYFRGEDSLRFDDGPSESSGEKTPECDEWSGASKDEQEIDTAPSSSDIQSGGIYCCVG